MFQKYDGADMRYLQSAGAVATLCTLVLASPRAGAATVFDFEAYGDLDPVTSLIVGVDLSNAVAMVAGQSLNELDFPPRSGTTVVIDTGGPIAIDFAVPVVSVGAWFTYVTGLTLTAFDAAFNVLGTDLSQFGANGATAGDPGSTPNEWLGFVSSTDIRRVTISGSN